MAGKSGLRHYKPTTADIHLGSIATTDSASEYISVANTTAIQNLDVHTTALVMYNNGAKTNGVVSMKMWNGVHRSRRIMTNGSDATQLLFTQSAATSGFAELQTASFFFPGAWVLYVVSWDINRSTNDRIHHFGCSDFRFAPKRLGDSYQGDGATGTTDADSSYPQVVGHNSSNACDIYYAYYGLWNEFFTEGHVQYLWEHLSKGELSPIRSSQLIEWKLGTEVGSSVTDLSGNGHTGTITSASHVNFAPPWQPRQRYYWRGFAHTPQQHHGGLLVR